MKTIRNIILAAGLIFAAARLPAQIAPYGIQNNDLGPVPSGPPDSIVQLTADAQGLPAVSPDQIPFSGTFWTIMPGFGLPLPFPCPPPGVNLPTYALPDGSFLVDDSATNSTSEADLIWQATEVTNLIGQAQAEMSLAQNRPLARAMDDGLPSPGDAGGTGEVITNALVVPPDYGTNLWIASPNIALNEFGAFASNTIDDIQYEIESVTNLAQTTNWVSQGFFLGSETTNFTPLNALATSKTNNFFIRLRSWIDTDGIGIPDWWQIAYFGYVGIDPYGDPAGDGWDNLYKFLHGMNPNVFYPPPAPQGVAVTYNTNGITTISWLPSPGAVTSYTVTINDYQSGTTTTFTTNSTIFSENLLADSTSAIAGGYPEFAVNYTIVAHYGTNGSSAPGSASLAGLSPPAPAVFNGAAGNLSLALPGLPADLSSVNIYRQSQLGALGDWWNPVLDLPDGTFTVSVSNITNGMLPIPNDQALPSGLYEFAVQLVHSNGLASDWSYFSSSCMDAPFLDQRALLKDNLRFILRAAALVEPFELDGNPDAGNSITYSSPLNYAFSDSYAGIYSAPGNILFDPLYPLDNNCLLANFVFTSANYDASVNGYLDTGAYYDSATDYLALTYPYPLYQYDADNYIAATNFPTPASLLTADDTQWIMPPVEDPYLPSGSVNVYGLPYLYAGQVDTDPVGMTAIAPGATNDYADFVDCAPPVFAANGYYFAQPGLDPMPEQTGFVPTNVEPVACVGLGNTINIAGYAKFTVSNSASQAPAYLGQYFDQAYEIDTNGIVTATTTGVLSPYGNFTPTQPGPVALVTMPDIDTGEQGTGTVHVASLQMDANHDGTMDLSFNGADATSLANPMRIWINDGNDGTGIGKDIDIEGNTNLANYAYGQIRSERNLENFFRLWICGLPLLPSSQGYSVTLSMTPITGNPGINLYPAYSSDGGTEYLTDTNVAAAQISTAYVTGTPVIAYGTALTNLNGDQSYQLPVDSYGNVVFTHFLFEGTGIGSGQLTLTISQNSNVIAQTFAYLDVHDINDFYERAVITNNMSGSISNWTSGIESITQATVSDPDEDTNLFVYVHGGDNGDFSWLARSDTIVKRLYWAGYHGKVATVRWPSPTEINLLDYGLQWFNFSELIGYKSASSLKTYLDQLHERLPGYQLDLFPQSLGGAPVSEALREGAPFDTLILCQNAVSASCYDVDSPTNDTLLACETGDGITPWTQPMGYCGAYTNFPGRIVNYFNTNDDYMKKWIYNEAHFKPPNSSYSYDGTNSWNYINIDDGESYLVTDSQESRAMVSRSRTWPIGGQGPVSGQTSQGAIQSTINLQAQFGIGSSGPEHSAFFTRPIQTIEPLYQQILIQIRPIP